MYTVRALFEKIVYPILSLKYLLSLSRIYIFRKPLNKGLMRDRAIDFLTISALFGSRLCPVNI